MSVFIQQFINGLSIGSIYALMAVGYSLVYSILNFSNFAHGGVIMLGAYFGLYAVTLIGGMPFLGALIIAALLAGLVAVVLEKIAYRPLRKRKRLTGEKRASSARERREPMMRWETTRKGKRAGMMT